MHVATLESHACSWAINHCMLMKCFFQIMLLVLQWGLLVYIRINSSMKAILYWEVVDEREGTVERGGQGTVLVSSSLFCDRCLEMNQLYSLEIKTTASMIPGVSRDGLSHGHSKGCGKGMAFLGCEWRILKLSIWKKDLFCFLPDFVVSQISSCFHRILFLGNLLGNAYLSASVSENAFWKRLWDFSHLSFPEST